MADRDGEIGSVQGVKVELVHPVRVQATALLGGDRGGDEAPGVGIVIETIEMPGHPIRDRSAAGRRHLFELGEIGDRQNARHDQHPDAGGLSAIAEPQK